MTNTAPTPSRQPRWTFCLLAAGIAALVLAAAFFALNREPGPPPEPNAGLAETPVDLPATRLQADQGDAAAQTRLGEALLHGQGLPADPRAAADWLQKAAAQGYAPAEYALGTLYEAGRGVPFDYAQAMAWYRQAAQRGHAAAQYSLAVMLSHGRGVPRNDPEAVLWLTRAAEAGLGVAQFALGHRASAGSGMPRDPSEAFKWFTLANARRVPDADAALRDLRTTMTAAQIAEGRLRADRFVPRTNPDGTPSEKP